MISSDFVLTHFNTRMPLVLACEASAYGLGVVLSHTSDLGIDKPIAFASRRLSKAECADRKGSTCTGVGD